MSAFLVRFIATFRSRFASKFLVRLTATFLSRFAATLLRARKSCFLWKFRSRVLSFLARFRSRTALSPVLCLTTAFELVRGFAYDRCRYCAAETLRCALMVLPVFARLAA